MDDVLWKQEFVTLFNVNYINTGHNVTIETDYTEKSVIN